MIAGLMRRVLRHSRPHNCAAFLTEVRLSACRLACKVHRCTRCGSEQVVHVAAYGVGHTD